MSEAGNKTNKSEMQSEMDALRSDMAKIQKDLHALTDTLVDLGKGRARDVKHQVESQFESGLDAVETYIEEKPMTTVLIAFGIGLLVAKLFGDK